ncbi:hypothetical protein M3Y95_01288600 [Aphelenchoides besseyi]|nr:hypothetical protein M3Y95_01288600 [Aphelenchoides besseyi]
MNNTLFYDGSLMLSPISEWTKIDIDMINLVFSQLISIPLAAVYRIYLSPEQTSRNVRLAYPLFWGIVLSYFCYGIAIKHPAILAAVCYLIMQFSPTKYVHKVVFIFAMAYLLFIHLYRYFLLDSFSIDITGPMMVAVQKVTTMAFSLHDGKVKKVGELTDIQKREALSEVPAILPYLSYLFHFQTVLTGPLCFYADYWDFINGKEMSSNERKKLNVWDACLPKFTFALCCAVVVALFGKEYYPEQLSEPALLKLPWYHWWWLLYLVAFLKRVQYYYAWIWADAVSNLSGFGFNGYDSRGRAKWNLISNVNAWRVETALSFKETLDHWNCTTMYWLRRVAFERVPKNYRTFSTYFLSAVWHGFFLGYYLTFLTAALFTVSARVMRRCLRHRFQSTWALARFYDCITFVVTKVALCYAAYPFITLHLNPGLFIYRRLYFVFHFVALFGALVLPRILHPQKRLIPTDTTKSDENKKST